jgi:hydrogenase-1 operon protein HyaF
MRARRRRHLPRRIARVREIVGDLPLLVPGIGAQGGDVEATLNAGKTAAGTGLMINSSRAILYAGKDENYAAAARKAASRRAMPSTDTGAEHGNALPILNEIRHALARLLESGETSVIDLGALPMGPQDEAELLAALGEGEVEATINAGGPSSVRETAFHGVWLLTHRNEAGETLARFIEVAFVPELLMSQAEDVADSAAELAKKIG